MFVSLAGPAGLLYMEECLKLAGRMGDAASRSGYGAGARMASALAGIFADMADIANRSVDDGALDWTYDAFQSMMGVCTTRARRTGTAGTPSRSAGWRRCARPLRASDPWRTQAAKISGGPIRRARASWECP